MRAISTNYGNNDTYVAIINSDMLLKFWENVPENDQINYELSHGNEESWVSDYKYHYAEDGFTGGISNPVPIPKIQYVNNITPNCITVSDCTRTIWLLANDADSFPVECEGYDNAKNVYDFIGEKEFELKTLAELMK